MEDECALSHDDLLLREEFGYKAINRTADFHYTSWGYGAWEKLLEYEARGLVRRWQPPLADHRTADDVEWVLTHGGILWLLQPNSRAHRDELGPSEGFERASSYVGCDADVRATDE